MSRGTVRGRLRADAASRGPLSAHGPKNFRRYAERLGRHPSPIAAIKVTN